MINNSIKKKFTYVGGYYCCETAYPVANVYNEPVIEVTDLKKHKSSNCWILRTENHIYLQSYSTIVSTFNLETKELHESKYSTATSRQQTWFYYELREEYGNVKRVIDKD